MNNLIFIVLFTSIMGSTCAIASSKVIVVGDAKWGYLNPLRGKLSPRAADLWGDRTKDIASGMLVRFNKGFSSPPHIHNISYRGIVIDGLMHNDDPSAEIMWMPTGSFWTQPAGENHITAAHAEINMIYLEVDAGPYLVKPSSKQFDNGEQALNLHRDNIVWLSDHNLRSIKADGVRATYIWASSSGIGGSMVKLPASFKGSIVTNANEFRAVVVSGSIEYRSKDQEKTLDLRAGSYIESLGEFEHKIENNGKKDVVIYIRTDAKYEVK